MRGVIYTCAYLTVLSLRLVGADEPAPAAYVGNWTGVMEQTFGLSNASDPFSLTCIPNGGKAIRSVSLNISSSSLLRAPLPALTVQMPGGNFTVPAELAYTWQWAAYSAESGILVLRDQDFTVMCWYARLSPDGRNLTLLILEGQTVTDNWMVACDSSSYEVLPNYMTQPYCAVRPGFLDIANSTTRFQLTQLDANVTPEPSVIPSPSPSPTLSSSFSASISGGYSPSRSATSPMSFTATWTRSMSNTPSFTETPPSTPDAIRYVVLPAEEDPVLESAATAATISAVTNVLTLLAVAILILLVIRRRHPIPMHAVSGRHDAEMQVQENPGATGSVELSRRRLQAVSPASW